MADTHQRPKRRLKNAETVRERAVKAQQTASQPRRQRLSFIGRGLRAAVRPLRPLSAPFRRAPFRWLGKPLRLLGRILLPRYFRNSWRELRLVTWPNRKESRQLTFAVIIFAVIFGALVSALDYGFDKLFKQVLIK